MRNPQPRLVLTRTPLPSWRLKSQWRLSGRWKLPHSCPSLHAQPPCDCASSGIAAGEIACRSAEGDAHAVTHSLERSPAAADQAVSMRCTTGTCRAVQKSCAHASYLDIRLDWQCQGPPACILLKDAALQETAGVWRPPEGDERLCWAQHPCRHLAGQLPQVPGCQASDSEADCSLAPSSCCRCPGEKDVSHHGTAVAPSVLPWSGQYQMALGSEARLEQG